MAATASQPPRAGAWGGGAGGGLREIAENGTGSNLFNPDDDKLLRSIVRGEFNISGFQNKTLRLHLPERNSGQASRLLKRLRAHGLIKKAGRTYKYCATASGKEVVATALKLRELVIIPQLASCPV